MGQSRQFIVLFFYEVQIEFRSSKVIEDGGNFVSFEYLTFSLCVCVCVCVCVYVCVCVCVLFLIHISRIWISVMSLVYEAGC